MPVLEPIEESPFKLEPVEGNPFSDSLQGNFGSASQQLLAQEAQRRGVVGNVLQHFTLPGRIAQGVQPQTPGMMTEEDAYRLNQQNNEALDWAHGQALNTIGTGMPMAEKMALGTGGGAIKAYHGSPYDFEKFDIGKIGTGEGAQSYGHGLYFAENPSTAQAYKDQLAHQNINVGAESLFADKPWMGPDAKYAATSAIERVQRQGLGGDEAVDAAAKSLHEQMKLAQGTTAKRRYQDAVNAIYDLRGKNWEAGKGRMYEVNINADPEHFLDWDKPLSEQHRETAAQLVPHRAAYYRDPNSSPSGASLVDDLTGGKFANQAAASEKLREVGIPGIKYLDQGSRGPSENPTHNYVVFHHDIVDILKKYGLAGLVGAGAAHFKTTPVEGNPYTQ